MQILSEIDALIRSAQGGEAIRKLQQLCSGTLPFGSEAKIAKLAFRAFIPELGIRLLQPVVYPSSVVKRPAKDEDRLAYAACLMRLGMYSNASNVISLVEQAANPEVLFLKASILTRQWNYADAIPLWKEYVKARTLNPYERLVGKTNLGTSLLHEGKYLEAKSVLGEVLEEASRQNYSLLLGNAMRFLGNIETSQGNWGLANEYYLASTKTLEGSESLDSFFSDKWIAINHFLARPSLETQVKLEQVQRRALQLKHWETVRDADLFKAIGNQDNTLFSKLYFGTPFESFRTRVLALSKIDIFPKRFTWEMKDGDKAFTLDLARLHEFKQPLKHGQAMHRLLLVLTSDFYRPFSLGELIEKVSLGERYLPGHSEARIHQIIQRVRAWLSTNCLPLCLFNHEGNYFLQATAPLHLTVGEERMAVPSSEYRLGLLKKAFPFDFTLNEAAQRLNLTASATGSLVNSALQTGTLKKLGKGKRTCYTFLTEK